MNKTRCPWCGKLIDKEADAEAYKKKHFYVRTRISFGRHYGICSHCGKIYNDVPKAAYVSIIVLLGILGISWIFPPILYSVVIVVPLLILISSRSCYFKRIDDNDSGVLKYDEAFKIKGNIVKQYYDLRNLEIYPLFNAHDQKEPFSSVSPIFISKLSKESNEFEGYWLYEHCDNSYFASLDSVHLYDDEGNVVADIRLK